MSDPDNPFDGIQQKRFEACRQPRCRSLVASVSGDPCRNPVSVMGEECMHCRDFRRMCDHDKTIDPLFGVPYHELGRYITHTTVDHQTANGSKIMMLHLTDEAKEALTVKTLPHHDLILQLLQLRQRMALPKSVAVGAAVTSGLVVGVVGAWVVLPLLIGIAALVRVAMLQRQASMLMDTLESRKSRL